MPDMLLRQVALVSQSKKVGFGDVAMVSAALQKQATRDLTQFWELKATVDAFEKLHDVPLGYWPIIIMDDIHQSGAAGIHLDKDGQPFALVTSSTQLNGWSVTASHEMCEMLVDPYGNRLNAGDSPDNNQGRVQFLVEVCDPSESAAFGYTINGVRVSDFYSVRFFDPVFATSVRYSFTGAVEAPRTIREGGYLSWKDEASDNWFQLTWFPGRGENEPTFHNLGPLSSNRESLRSQIDRLTYNYTERAISEGLTAVREVGVPLSRVQTSTSRRAESLIQQITELTEGGPGRQGPGRRDGGDRPEPAAAEDHSRRGSIRAESRADSGRENGQEAPNPRLRMVPSAMPSRFLSHH